MLTGTGTNNNTVAGSLIGTDPTGLHALPNNWGVFVTGGASNNTFGGTTTAARDVISGTSSNQVEGNYIGTDVSSGLALGNGLGGVQIESVASSNLIGGTSASDYNLIEFNAGNGVGIGPGSFGNVLEFDIINLNGGNGVLFDSAAGNTIYGCTIEANGAWGILDTGSGNDYVYNTLANNLDGSVGH